jgi:hypothetical protein
MFIFHRSFWAVGAGVATACAIVAASLLLNRPAAPPSSAIAPAASTETRAQADPAS